MNNALLLMTVDADLLILELVEQIIKDHPHENMQNDPNFLDVFVLVSKAINWCDALRSTVNVETILER